MKCLLLFSVLVSRLSWTIAQQCPPPSQDCFCLQANRRVRCGSSALTQIPSFPASIQQSIVFLEFENNLITSINATDLQGLTSVREINLGLNHIRFIEEGSFSSNSALEVLDLSHNMLSELPDGLFNSSSIFTLDLSNNNFSILSPSAFAGVQNSATIRLNGNQISTLDQEVFIDLNLDELGLSNNPIRCDCDLQWLPMFVDFIRIRNMLGSCHTPAHLTGVSLESLTEDQLCNCIPSCVNGTCNTTVGECECDDGYIGTSCDTSCPAGLFGANCTENCSCLSERESSPCNAADGTCNCLPGYTGLSCEEDVDEGETTDTTGANKLLDTPSSPAANTDLPVDVETTVASVNATNGANKLLDTPSSPAASTDLPVYGLVLITIGASLIATGVILLVAISIGGWISKTSKTKIMPTNTIV